MKYFKGIIISIFLLIIIPGCGNKEEKSHLIKVGVSPLMSSAGIFIAREKGYFENLGLNVDLTIFKSSGAAMTMLLSAGKLDVGGGNLSTGLWSAINQGVDLYLVADKGHIEKDHSHTALLVRKDLVTTGRYKSFKDLKNYRMGLTVLEGVSQQIVTERFLNAGGLTLDDVEFIKMSYSEMNISLRNHTLDATIQLEPYVINAELEEIAQNVADANEVYPDQQSAAIFYSSNFMRHNPKLAEKFMVAYLQGVRAYKNAFVYNIKKSEIISILKKHINIESESVWDKMAPIGLNPDGFINKASLLNDIRWYKEKGYIEKVPDINKVIDHSYVEKALKVIGKYGKI